ncbi:response regulator [Bacillota bacterium Lsc_1132]
MKAEELYRVLIVDDEQLIRKGIVHFLDWEQKGFLVVGEAANGQEALDLIEAVKPHIIITDIVMPILDGEELTKIVKARYPDIEMIILSSFDEFDYVRSTFQHGIVDYILKPKLDAQSLLKGLQAAARRIPLSISKNVKKISSSDPSIEEIVNKLILGHEVTFDEEFVAKVFPYRQFFLLGVDLKNHPKKEAAEIKVTINEKIRKDFRAHIGNGVCYSFSPAKNLIVFLLNIEDHKQQEIINLTSEFIVQEPDIGLALTEAFLDFSQIGEIYKESLVKLLDSRFYLSELPLIMKENFPAEVPQCEKFNLEWFANEFKCKRFNSAFSYLNEYTGKLSSCYMMDIFEYKSFFINIIFNIITLLSNMEYDVKELETARYEYFQAIEEVKTAQEAGRIVDAFLTVAKKSLADPQHEQEYFSMKMLVDYMMEHYTEPITLAKMAKHFHFNPSYLSSYFSVHMGEGFSEYLNKIRIEEAARLLLQNTFSISEISGMVGYSDHSYFCKVFKKIKGLSPSQYKRKYK